VFVSYVGFGLFRYYSFSLVCMAGLRRVVLWLFSTFFILILLRLLQSNVFV